MTPDERQLLSGLFDRIGGQANQVRDREAEGFINDKVRTQPYAPYLLSQTVIVQEQALRAAAERIQQLEAQVQGGGAQPQEETSFLGSIGKSLFGSGQPQGQGAPRGSVPPTGGYGTPQQDYRQQDYRQQAAPGGPWGGQGGYGGQPQGGGFANAAPGGGGFLKGALGAAAGVAGGVLAVDAIRGLFGGHNNPFGIASGGGFGQPGGETIVNNYYDDGNSGGTSAADDARQDFLQDQSDDFASNDAADDAASDADDSSWT